MAKNFTSDAQEDEAVVAGIVVEVFAVAKRLLEVLGGVDFCQKLFGDFGEVSDDLGVTRENDVAARDDAEQDGHRDAEMEGASRSGGYKPLTGEGHLLPF